MLSLVGRMASREVRFCSSRRSFLGLWPRPAVSFHPKGQGAAHAQGQETGEDVGPDGLVFVVVDGAKAQGAFEVAEGSLGLGQSVGGAPQVTGGMGHEIGAQKIAAILQMEPVADGFVAGDFDLEQGLGVLGRVGDLGDGDTEEPGGPGVSFQQASDAALGGGPAA